MCFLGPVVVYLFPVAWDSAEKYESAWDSELTPSTERACSVSTVSQVAISDAPLTRVTWYRTIPSSMCGFNKVGWICRPQLPTMPSMPLVQVRFKASWVRSTTCKQGLDPDSFWTYESSTTLNLGFRGRKKTLFFFFFKISYVNWISRVLVCGKHSVLSVRLFFWKCLLLNLMFYFKTYMNTCFIFFKINFLKISSESHICIISSSRSSLQLLPCLHSSYPSQIHYLLFLNYYC